MERISIKSALGFPVNPQPHPRYRNANFMPTLTEDS